MSSSWWKSAAAAAARAPRAPAPLSAATLAKVHAKLKAASYTSGGQDWAKLFGQYDRDRSGSLDAGELTMATRASLKLNQADLPDDEIASLFAMLDADGSGALEIAEFVEFLERGPALLLAPAPAARRRRRKPLPAAKLAQVHAKLKAASYTSGGMDWAMLFRQYDKDRSGSLDDGELKTAVRATLKLPPAALPDAAIEALFDMLDADRGGAIDLGEFEAFLEHGAGVLLDPAAAAATAAASAAAAAASPPT